MCITVGSQHGLFVEDMEKDEEAMGVERHGEDEK
jgi:hypothetical protein